MPKKYSKYNTKVVQIDQKIDEYKNLLATLSSISEKQKGNTININMVPKKPHWNNLFNLLINYRNIDSMDIIALRDTFMDYPIKTVDPIYYSKLLKDTSMEHWGNMNIYQQLKQDIFNSISIIQMKRKKIKDPTIQEYILPIWDNYKSNNDIVFALYPQLLKTTENNFSKIISDYVFYTHNQKNIKEILDYIKNEKIKIIKQTEKELVVSTKSRVHLNDLGSSQWCFNNTYESYDRYIKNNYEQLIYFNFNLFTYSQKFLIGLTLDENKELIYGYDNHNFKISKEEENFYKEKLNNTNKG